MTKSTAASIAAIAVFYALLQVFVLPPNGFFTGDQGPKYLQAAAFAAQGPLSPDIHVLSRDVDTGLDYQDPILHRRGSHLVSAFSWLLPMLTAPFLRLLGMRGSYVIPAFSVMVIFVTARRLGRALGLGSGLWSAWAAVAATPVLFFGAELWEHAPAAAAVMTTAVLLAPRPGAVAPDREPIWRFAAAGACAVVAALFREEGGLALPSFLIARAIVTRNGRDTARATGGALLGAAAAFSASVPLNVAVYGSRLPLHLSSEIEKTHAYLATRLDAIRDMVLPAPGAALFVVAVLVAPVALRTSRRRSPASRAMIASASVIGILASRRILFAASPDRIRDVAARARAIGIREIDVVTQPPDSTIVPEQLDGRCRLPAGNGPIALGRALELRRYTCHD